MNLNLKDKKANPPKTQAISMLDILSERYDMSEPEVHRDVASALCDVLRCMSRITGKGATEFLTMYQMTLNGSDKQV